MNKTRLEDVKDKKTGLPVLDPKTGAVQKREVSNRRAGYDFTFSVPKSVSLYLAVNEDKILEQMIAEALDETMAMIESRMETKVRKGYQQDNRVSPNMVYAKFVHGETGTVDGIPDPHYHIHVFAMNATFDEVEKEWKALEVGNTVGDRTFYEASPWVPLVRLPHLLSLHSYPQKPNPTKVSKRDILRNCSNCVSR